MTANLFLHAQELPVYSQYLFNPAFINPAAFGTSNDCAYLSKVKKQKKQKKKAYIYNYTNYMLTDRHQWLDIPGAPNTQAFALDIRQNNVGLGLVAMNDVNGATFRRGVSLAYSYRTIRTDKLDDPQLSIGISLEAYQFGINTTNLFNTPELMNDPLALAAGKSMFLPDASAGALLFTDNFHLGFSVAQILRPTLNYDPKSYTFNFLDRDFFLNAGYTFPVTELSSIELSGLIKSTQNINMQYDITPKWIYNKNFWVALSYRTQTGGSDLMLLTGYRLKYLSIAYAYDYAFQGLGNSHELMISYTVCRVTTKSNTSKAIPCKDPSK